MKKLFLIVLVVGVFLSVGCKKSDGSKYTRKRKTRTVVVFAEHPAYRHLKNFLSYSVPLKARRDVFVYATTSQRVKKIYKKEGDFVKKNEILAKLDDEEALYRFKKAKAYFDKVKNNFERTKKLYKEKMVSDEAYENSKSDYESAEADYKLQKKNYDDLTIKSPITGIVGRKYIDEEVMVQTGQRLFRIVDNNILKATVNLPESEYRFIKRGSVALIETSEGAKIKGYVNSISPIIDESTGTFYVEVYVRGRRDIIPGMFVTVDIITREKQKALSIPSKAIVNSDKKKGVFVYKNGKAKFVPVKFGIVDADYVEVLDGLTSKDLVVTIGQNVLKDGMSIKLASDNKDKKKKSGKRPVVKKSKRK